jgi:DNA polymerase-3 subunit beta
MEFTIDREKLLVGIQKTLGIIEKQNGLPILQHVLIRTMESNDRIEILATNREIGIRTDYDASVIKPGQMTIPAKKLSELIKELEGETVHLVTKGKGSAVITCNKVVSKINGLDASDFPESKDAEGYESFEMSAALLSDMIKKVIYAVSKDDSRKNISGIYMQKISKDNIPFVRMSATDGHRLAIISDEMSTSEILDIIPEKGLIIPRKGISEMRKIAEDGEGDIRLGFTRDACILEAGRATLRVNLIDGDYPDITRVIPDDNAAVILRLVVSRGEILHSLRRMAVYDGSCCSLHVNGDFIHFEAKDPDIGEIKDEIEILNVENDDGRAVKFNVGYLIESIESVSVDNVQLNIHAGMGPCVIHGVDDKNYTGIVMPLKG